MHLECRVASNISTILNISTIFHDFTKIFSKNWRAQRGKFFEYTIDLSGFFFRNSILILNKLARAARKIFSYLIDFSQKFLAISVIFSRIAPNIKLRIAKKLHLSKNFCSIANPLFLFENCHFRSDRPPTNLSFV